MYYLIYQCNIAKLGFDQKSVLTKETRDKSPVSLVSTIIRGARETLLVRKLCNTAHAFVNIQIDILYYMALELNWI
jgi:hypothetical protein